MALPREYARQDCALARALEVIGERWTLLIVRDAFYGVTRFSDFRDHLDIPRAVLSERLGLLVDHEILERTVAPSGRDEYALTTKGQRLWPTIRALLSWGNEYYVPDDRRRQFTHADCGGAVDGDGSCASCGAEPDPQQLILNPRPRKAGPAARDDQVSRALSAPHRLLDPVTTAPR
jgi:DNA-binding HxlR family transcriptional regulator